MKQVNDVEVFHNPKNLSHLWKLSQVSLHELTALRPGGSTATSTLKTLNVWDVNQLRLLVYV